MKYNRKKTMINWMDVFVLVVSIFFLNHHEVNAQKFGDGDPVWHYGATSFWGNFVFPVELSIAKDTIFNQKSCKILKSGKNGYPSRLPYKQMICQDSSKVTFWCKYKNDFQVLYDFGAKMGTEWDVWYDRNFDPPYYDSVHVVVDSVYTITINNKNLIVQQVTYSAGPNSWNVEIGTHTIIELIGDVNSMFPLVPLVYDIDYIDSLRCFENNSIGLHQLVADVGCDYTDVGVDEVQNNDAITLFPNPTNGKITLKGLDPKATHTYVINTLNGQQVAASSIKSERIHISDLKSGVYFVSISKNGVPIACEKLVVYE